MYYIGIDSGSTNCKIVLFKDVIIDSLIIKTTWNAVASAKDSMHILLDRHHIMTGDYKVIVTGYGREGIDQKDFSLTEISCHALGGWFLKEGIDGIVDIGGQDCKVIELNDSKIMNFYMNDKCAAGTGSFLTMACAKLDIELNEIDSFITDDKYVSIASMCAVFAESEIVGLLAQNISRSEILLGVIVSIAYRIDQILGKAGFLENDTLLLTGGLAQSKIIRKTIANITKMNIVSDPQSIYAGAIGACIYGKNKNESVM